MITRMLAHSTVEAMAKYSKQLWPTMTTMIQATPRWLAGAPVTYAYLDAGWAQYQSALGSASSWIGKEVGRQDEGLGLVVGLNVLDGGASAPSVAELVLSEAEGLPQGDTRCLSLPTRHAYPLTAYIHCSYGVVRRSASGWARNQAIISNTSSIASSGRGPAGGGGSLIASASTARR